MNRQDFRCLEPLRVRWAEVDMQGIVFNGHYLMYVDTALAEYYAETVARVAFAPPIEPGDLTRQQVAAEAHRRVAALLGQPADATSTGRRGGRPA